MELVREQMKIIRNSEQNILFLILVIRTWFPYETDRKITAFLNILCYGYVLVKSEKKSSLCISAVFEFLKCNFQDVSTVADFNPFLMLNKLQ